MAQIQKEANYQQGYNSLQELERELNKGGEGVCHACLNKINEGNWQRKVSRDKGKFLYQTKLITATKCLNCQEIDQLEQQIREQEQQYRKIADQAEQENFSDQSENSNNEEGNYQQHEIYCQAEQQV
ncbi:MAG: hypothetical protein NY202_04620 [Mollicutes bacterium UO1]